MPANKNKEKKYHFMRGMYDNNKEYERHTYMEDDNQVVAQKGSEEIKNYRHEQFSQLVAHGTSASDAYAKLYNKTGVDASNGATRLMQVQYIVDRIKHLRHAEVASWSKDRATEELKRIIDDCETKAREKIQAIAELNDIHGLKRPTTQSLNIENKGIVFNCPDGISLPPGFLESQSKRLRDVAEGKTIDVTPQKKEEKE